MEWPARQAPAGKLEILREKMEAPPGFEPGMEVLQTSALPLGYGAAGVLVAAMEGAAMKGMMERETGFEPATSTLARSHSTTELFPPAPGDERQA